MIGTKFNKPLEDTKAYAECAGWCNANGATIEDKGKYYECVPLPEPSLDDVKATKITELKATRDKLEVAPLNNFDVDEKSLSRIDIASKILTTGAIPSLEWTMADNTVKDVTSADFTSLYVALATRSNDLHEQYRNLKAEVNAATTAAEVAAIQWAEVENGRAGN